MASLHSWLILALVLTVCLSFVLSSPYPADHSSFDDYRPLPRPKESSSLKREVQRAMARKATKDEGEDGEFLVQGLGTPFSGQVFRDLASAYTGQLPEGEVNLLAQDAEKILSATSFANVSSDFNITEAFVPLPGYLNVPIGVGAVVMVYNLDVSRNLVLSGDILAQIYLMQIVFWNDSQIAELNPGLELPPAPIIKIIDKSPSYLTLCFTTALSAMSPAWAFTVGPTDVFPPILYENNPTYFQTDEVSIMPFLRATSWSMTPISYAFYRLQSTVTRFAYMKNRSNQTVTVSPLSLAVAQQPAVPGQPMAVGDSGHPLAWPMGAASYLQLPLPTLGNSTGCAQARHALDWAAWILSSYLGQLLAGTGGFLLPLGAEGVLLDAAAQLEGVCPGGMGTVDPEGDLSGSGQFSSGGEAEWAALGVSPYSPSPGQVWSSWFGELGSPLSASQVPSFHFSPAGSSRYVSPDGFLVPTAQISPDFAFSPDPQTPLSPEVNSAPLRSFSALLVTALAFLTLWICESHPNRHLRTLLLCTFLFCFLLGPSSFCSAQRLPRLLNVAGLFPLTGPNSTEGVQEEVMIRLALEKMGQSPLATESLTHLQLLSLNTRGTDSGIVRATNLVGQASAALTPSQGRVAVVATPILESLLLPHLSLASTEELGTGESWSLLSRFVPPDRFQGLALADVIDHFGWGRTVGTFSTSDIYGASLLRLFELRAKFLGWAPLATAEFVPGKPDLWREVQEVRDSQARVLVNLMGPEDFREVLRHAERLGMTRTSQYVWLCSDACASSSSFLLPLSGTSPESSRRRWTVDWTTRERMAGMLGIRLAQARGGAYEEFLTEWAQLDPLEYPGAGGKLSLMAPYAYDMALSGATAALSLLTVPDPTIRLYKTFFANTTIQGLTGTVVLDPTGSFRMPQYDIVNLRALHQSESFYEKPHSDEIIAVRLPGMDFDIVGTWDILRGPEGNKVRDLYQSDFVEASSKGKVLQWEKEIQWAGGVEEIPNLDVRNPAKYWSCQDHQMLEDETGRSIRLDPPNGGNGDIAHYYRCDNYIDCHNMSDEWGCSVSFPVVFIVYGIAQGLLFLFALLCLVFTCVFGFCLRRRRVRAASPTFLILMVLACMLGYVGLFSFYGQPQSVACGFRIWIVCVSVVLMIAALFTKSFRIWRLYRSPTEIKAMQDWKLVLLVVILVLPVLILLALWTGLSTPKADLRKENDGHEHKMCMPGGVAQEAGGYTFFALIVAYIGLLLLFGAFLSFVTRNVSSTFNESRLIAVSIFNLVFLGIVVIPIYFVLLNSGPVVLWVIIVTAVLYGLSATLFLQFLPKMWGVFVRDRLVDKSDFTRTTQSDTAPGESNTGGVVDSKAIW